MPKNAAKRVAIATALNNAIKHSRVRISSQPDMKMSTKKRWMQNPTIVKVGLADARIPGARASTKQVPPIAITLRDGLTAAKVIATVAKPNKSAHRIRPARPAPSPPKIGKVYAEAIAKQ